MDGSGLLALLFIDLDRFKIVNDSMGHKAGDELLCTVAGRLREHVRAQDTVGRLAGDEFVVICEELESVDEAIALAERMGEAVAAPILTHPVEGSVRTVNVGASIGIATASRASRVAPTDLIRDADVAMYHAKQQGRGRAVVFDEALRVAVQQRLETQEDLRRAIAEGQLSLAYQRVVDVEAGETPTFEALVRWEHPQRGWLPPAEFIPIAEETGLIVPLGAWVLRQACRDAARWRAMPRTASVGVSVNLSARQLAETSLVTTVAGVLRETGLEADALWLEITETALMDDAEAASATLTELRALGLHLAIDDFGTGYSSLAYLRRFPVEVLKIDRSFVERLGEDAEDAAVVDLVVHLARVLNLAVIAEGVETDVQLRQLRRLGCRRVQGYYFGRPLPVAEALAALTGQTPTAPQTPDTARVAAPLG
jgi:diguanylate cyclase (GGDEF)-like protein